MNDKTELTPEDVKEILRLVDESGVEELELETPRFTVRFRRSADRSGEPQQTGDPGSGSPEDECGTGPRPEEEHSVEVTAPMVGTFYRAIAPGEPSFVEVGSTVDEGTTVCIIEVMKLMSSVAAGVQGTITEICFANATPVQYGDVLFRVQPL